MYEDFLCTMLHIRRTITPEERPVPSVLEGARYSGPAEVDGDHGKSSTLAAGARAKAPAHAAGVERRDPMAPAPKASKAKPRTYRKSEDPDPYVGVGRNDPCPCGSGKKFKNCHGRNR